MISKNDNANGIVQLSASAVSVHEPHTGSVVNVTRTAGDFGTVSKDEFEIRFGHMVKHGLSCLKYDMNIKNRKTWHVPLNFTLE